MERQPRNIRSTLVEPFKQIKLGVYIIAVSIFFVGFVSTLVVYAFMEQYKQLMEIFNVVGANSQWELVQNSVFEKNILRIGMAMAFYIVSLFLIVFWATHRFFGPLITIGRFVAKISDGDYTARVSVRKRDELQDLVAQLNQMAETLESRHGPSGKRERRNGGDDIGRRSSDKNSSSAS